MSTRQVITLWIIAAVLGAAVATMKLTEHEPPAEPTARQRGDWLLPDFPANEVAAVQLRDATTTTNLGLRDGKWVVTERGNYPAAVAKIGELLRTLADLKVAQAIPSSAAEFSRFGLESQGEAAGITLTFQNAAGAELATLVIGKRLNGDEANDPLGMASGSGRFIRNAADPGAVYVVSQVFPDLSTQPQAWLDDTFLQVDKIRSIRAARPGVAGFQPWTVSRADEAAEFTLDSPPANTVPNQSNLSPLKSVLANTTFQDAVPRAELASALDSPEAWEFTIETFEGLTYQLRAAPLNKDGQTDNAQAEYAVTATIKGQLPAARNPGANEKPEDKAQLDEAFKARRAILEARLASNALLDGRAFRVTRWPLDPLVKSAADFSQPAPAPQPNEPPAAITRPEGEQ